VVVVPTASAPGITAFAGLASPAIARIAIANPKTAPAGRYAEEVFASAGVAAAVRPKLILAENVRQVLDYVGRGEVDAGVVYATDAMTRTRDVRVAAVAPEVSHRPAIYPIAVLKGSTHPEAAKAFVGAVRSEPGQALLARHGSHRSSSPVTP
jgi:molybdate transport system substrate-binding protein